MWAAQAGFPNQCGVSQAPQHTVTSYPEIRDCRERHLGKGKEVTWSLHSKQLLHQEYYPYPAMLVVTAAALG